MTYTLETAAAAFLRAKRRRLAESSFHEYQRVVDKLVSDLGAELEVAELQPPTGTEIIEEFLEERWGDCPHAYNRNLSVIRGLMKFLIQREHLHSDPTLPIERSQPEQHVRSTFDETEIHRIIDAAGNPRDKVALRLLLIYGLRKGALTGLQFVCFDYMHHVVAFKTKGSKYHNIPIPHKDEIWDWLDAVGGQPSEYLLHRHGDRAQRLSPHGVHLWWYARLVDAQIVEPGTTSGQRMHKARHALALDTEVLTTEGWTTIGRLEAGDHVYAEDGTETTVLATSDIFETSPCYRVEFADTSSVVATGDHLWHVWDSPNGGQWRVLSTLEIARKQRIGSKTNRYRVRCDAQVQTLTIPLPIDPYLLGRWLGDGTVKSFQITVGHKDLDHLLDEIDAAGYTCTRRLKTSAWGSGWELNISIKNSSTRGSGHQGAWARLKRLGIFYSKRIPDVYLRASVEQRRALLEGLMDSDGSITCDKGHGATSKFDSVLPELAADFHQLVRGLGIRASIRERQSRGRRFWSIAWTATFNPFRLSRKSERFVPQLPVVQRLGRRSDLMSIVDVQPTKTAHTRCIEVDHPSHVFLVTRGFVPTHNSAGQRVLNKTQNLKAVQQLLGHASIQTTGDVYSSWDQEQLRSTMESIGG